MTARNDNWQISDQVYSIMFLYFYSMHKSRVVSFHFYVLYKVFKLTKVQVPLTFSDIV